jgi:hypothetical protein
MAKEKKEDAKEEAKAQVEETEIARAMRESGITEKDLDDRPGQRGVVDHGDRIVFHCVTRAADGTISGHFTKNWVRK